MGEKQATSLEASEGRISVAYVAHTADPRRLGPLLDLNGGFDRRRD